MTFRDSYDRAMVRYIIRREIISHWLRRKVEWARMVAQLYDLHRTRTVVDGEVYQRKPVLEALGLALRQASE